MKQIKLLGILAIALSLGLAACNNGGGEGGDESQAGEVSECTKHEWGPKETIKEATCTEAGQTQRTCKVCGAKEEPKEVKALGHDWKDTVTTEPGCETKGAKDRVCQRCGASEKGVEIPATGHNVEGQPLIEDTPAQVGVAGEGHRVCLTCGQNVPEVIPALVASFTVSKAQYVKEDNKVYLVLEGSEKYFTAANFKFAFGLKLEGGDTWLAGKAAPEAADFNVLGTITEPAADSTADPTFVVKFDMTSINAAQGSKKAGLYNIYVGTSADNYGTLSLAVSNTDGANTMDEVHNYYFRNDQETSNVLTAGISELPPFHLTAASLSVVEKTGEETSDQVWVKIGGAARDQSKTAEALQTELNALDPFIQFQSTGNSYYQPEGSAERATEGLGYNFKAEKVDGVLNAYLNINVTFMDGQSSTTYNTHVNMLEHSQDNCVMEGDFLSEEVALPSGKLLKVFSNSNGKYNTELGLSGRNAINSANNAYGNLGFRVEDAPIKSWSEPEIEAVRDNVGWNDAKDWGNGVKGFKFNKVGGFTLSYTPGEDVTSNINIKLQLLISVKYSNKDLTGFWKQPEENGHAAIDKKTAIEFNGTEVTAPTTDISFANVVKSSVTDSGELSVPQWFDVGLTDLAIVAGQENTIKVSYVAGGCSYYICGARIVNRTSSSSGGGGGWGGFGGF